MKIKKSDLLNKKEKNFIEVEQGSNKIKINDLLSNKEISITRKPGAKEAEDAYRNFVINKSYGANPPAANIQPVKPQVNINAPVMNTQPVIDPLDEDALRINMANNRTEPTAIMKAASFVGKNLYNNIVKPVGQAIDRQYEKLDDYNFGEKALNDAYRIAQENSQSAWDEETLRLQRLKNDYDKLLSYMTPEQKLQYSRMPENKKKDYLDGIMAQLQMGKGAARAEEIRNINDRTNQNLQKIGLSFESGMGGFKTGLKGAYNLMRGADETVAKNASEYAFDELRPETKGALGVAMDLSNTVGNMAPSIALGLVGGPLGVGALGTAAMGVSSAGKGYDSAIGEGYTPEQAAAYGVASGVSEALLQKIAGALPGVSNAQGLVTRFLGKYGDDVLSKVVSNPSLRKALVTLLGNAASEGSEEGAQEIIDTFIRNTVLGEDNDINWKDVGYSALLGGMTGGAFAVPGGVSTVVNRDSNIDTAQPAPETTQPTSEAVENTADAVRNDVEIPEEVTEENTVAETEPIAETEEEVIESKPITDAVKRTVKAVNPDAENSQQIFRQIMRNNGFGKLVDTLDYIAQKFGIKLEYYADDTNSEGYYENGVIGLNISNLRNTEDGIWKVFKHELTHFIEGTAGYGELSRNYGLSQMFIDYYNKGNYSFTDREGNELTGYAAFKEILKERYAKNGVNLTPAQIQQEAFAKFIEDSELFTNEESIRRLAVENPNLIQKIYRWIKETIAKIGATPETRRLMELEKIYERALGQAARGEFKYQKDGGKEYLFVRENDPDTIKKASDKELAGDSPEDIWFEEGVKRDSKGNWITEINDREAKFNAGNVTSGKLSDVLKHDVLYSIYPDAADIDFEFKTMPARKNGSYSPNKNKITLNSKFKNPALNDKAKTTLIHEIQHYLQVAEDRSIGGSKGSVYTYLMNRFYAKYSNNKSFQGLKDYFAKKRYLEDKIKKAYGGMSLEKILFNEYRAIEGEEEARAAADRKDLKAVERRYDYPKYGGNGIDLTDAEDYTESVTRDINSVAMGRRSVSPAIENLHKKLGGRMYDEAGVYSNDTHTESRRLQDGRENILRDLGIVDGSKNNDQVFGETSSRSTQALQNEQTAKVGAQKYNRDSELSDKSRINNKEQAGNGLFFNARKQYSFSTDSKGRQLTPEQQEYFKDSKVRDEEGRLLTVYHGTKQGGFTVFNKNLNYYTNNKDMADSYSPKGDMYEGYLDIKKPFVIDANGDKWSGIAIDKETKDLIQAYGGSVFKERGKWRTSPADIASVISEAVEEGELDYDGVIVLNVDDTGMYYKTKSKNLGNDYITFNSNQFKNIDNAKPTNNPDIRYSFKDDGKLTKKAESYLHRNTNTLLNDFLEITETDKFADARTLKRDINTFAEASVRNGEVDRAEAEKLFDTLYWDALKVNTDVYDKYRPIAEQIKNTKLYGGGLGSLEGEYRRKYFNKVRLVTDPSATKIDSYYKELSELYPELFDPEIANIEDQVPAMAEAIDYIYNRETKLSDLVKNIDERYNVAKEEFMASLDKFEQGIEDVIRYNDAKEAKADAREALKAERKESAEKIPIDRQFTKKFYEDLTAAERKYEWLAKKEMLTPDDTSIMRQLSEGTIKWDEVERRADEFNINAIKKVYDAYNTKHQLELTEQEHRNDVLRERREEAESSISDSDSWKDKPAGAMYARETMERNIEDITKKGNNNNRRNEDAYWINKTYFKPVHENEAKSNRLKKELGDRVRALKLGTKPMYTVMIENEYTGTPVQTEVSESGLVQLYGEGLIDDNTLDRVGADKEKIHKAVNEFRGIYNQLIEMANETLIRNGYRPVEYRKDYFPHFTENKPDSTLGKVASYFGIELRSDELPTDIAGITHTFRPGKKWVGNFLERKTNVTDYDALKGFDRYINGAADVIFHTDDIQRLRALESALRYKYSDEGTRKRIKEIEDSTTLTPEEKNSRIEDIMKANEVSHLPHLVTEIRNYTDNLAGKKSKSDRDWEDKLGRSMYKTMQNIENRVSANMVALNPGSWLTNFIPITQVSGIVDPRKLGRAIIDAGKASIKDDGFRNKSDFLVNRKGSEATYKKRIDKAQDKATWLFSVIDNFSADVVTRALYYDKMAEVHNEAEALEYANDMAARVMADRSKGAKPTAFNAQNPVAKLFTMFQVEVNNQYSYMLKDVPADLRKKGLMSLAVAFFEIFASAYLYNELYEWIVGRRAAFDPAGLINEAAGSFTGKKFRNTFDIAADIATGKGVDFIEEVNAPGTSEAIKGFGKEVLKEAPFIGNLAGGGRLPIAGAIPNPGTMIDSGVQLLSSVITGDTAGNKQAIQKGAKELIKPIAYMTLPFGGGQAKKTLEGFSTLVQGGEKIWNSKGEEQLKYPIEEITPFKVGQAFLFGRSSLPEARDYYESGSPLLTAKQTQNYHKAVEAGINYKQYMAALRAVKGLESDKDKDGKTIALSLAKNKKAAIDEAVKEFNLTKKQKELLYEANDVSEKVW